MTAILVNRYFGSKEALFSAVVEVAFSDDRLFTGDVSTLADRVARHIVAKAGGDGESVDPLLLMLRSASNVRAAEIIRESIERHFERPLATSLSGTEVRVRAALFLAVIAGYQLFKNIIASAALVDAEVNVLSDRLASLFQLLIDDRLS